MCVRGRYAVDPPIAAPGGYLGCCCNSNSSSSAEDTSQSSRRLSAVVPVNPPDGNGAACVASIAWLSEPAFLECCICLLCDPVPCVSVACLPYGSYAVDNAAGGGAVSCPHVLMGYARPLRQVSLTAGKYWRYDIQAQAMPRRLPVITSNLHYVSILDCQVEHCITYG